MDITESNLDQNIVLLSLSGELDLYNSSQVKDRIIHLWEGGMSRLIVDLSELSYMDSSGIGVILYIYTGSTKRQARVIFSGVQGSVKKVIELTKLNGFLPMAGTVEQARTELGPDRSGMLEDSIKQLRADDNDPLFSTAGMYGKSFNIDLSHVRRLSNLIAQRAPTHLRDINILEQQISELLKNAVRHGNGNDKTKAVKVWFRFTDDTAHLIVEDEGAGFQRMEEWNEFYRRKIEAYRNQDFEAMMNYLSFRTPDSNVEDGGNAMMAAIEYWNQGVVFNDRRNAVAVKRSFSSDLGT